MSNQRTRLARLAATIALTAGIFMGLGGSASAHNVLISSDPADGSTVSAVPTSLTFTFDQPVQNFDPVVSLVGPDGKQYAVGAPVVNGNVVTGQVGPGPAGAYVAAYRVVSADGHPVTGQIHFTLAVGAVPAPATTVSGSSQSATDPGTTGSVVTGQGTPVSTATGSSLSPPAAAGGTADPASGGLSAGLWVGLVVAALIIAAAAVILLRRPAAERTAQKDY